jgi:hypothetical protein
MTDYRDPNYRDPNRPGYRDPVAPADPNNWSTATWGWIAGISVVVLILIFAFGMGGGDGDRTTKDTTRPQTTTGQRALPPAPPTGAEAPSMNPAPTPPSPPAKQ